MKKTIVTILVLIALSIGALLYAQHSQEKKGDLNVQNARKITYTMYEGDVISIMGKPDMRKTRNEADSLKANYSTQLVYFTSKRYGFRPLFISFGVGKETVDTIDIPKLVE